MNTTLDELIEQLQELADFHGGNTPVRLEIGTAYGGEKGVGAEWNQNSESVLLFDERLH